MHNRSDYVWRRNNDENRDGRYHQTEPSKASRYFDSSTSSRPKEPEPDLRAQANQREFDAERNSNLSSNPLTKKPEVWKNFENMTMLLKNFVKHVTQNQPPPQPPQFGGGNESAHSSSWPHQQQQGANLRQDNMGYNTNPGIVHQQVQNLPQQGYWGPTSQAGYQSFPSTSYQMGHDGNGQRGSWNQSAYIPPPMDGNQSAWTPYEANNLTGKMAENVGYNQQFTSHGNFQSNPYSQGVQSQPVLPNTTLATSVSHYDPVPGKSGPNETRPENRLSSGHYSRKERSEWRRDWPTSPDHHFAPGPHVDRSPPKFSSSSKSKNSPRDRRNESKRDAGYPDSYLSDKIPRRKSSLPRDDRRTLDDKHKTPDKSFMKEDIVVTIKTDQLDSKPSGVIINPSDLDFDDKNRSLLNKQRKNFTSKDDDILVPFRGIFAPKSFQDDKDGSNRSSISRNEDTFDLRSKVGNTNKPGKSLSDIDLRWQLSRNSEDVVVDKKKLDHERKLAVWESGNFHQGDSNDLQDDFAINRRDIVEGFSRSSPPRISKPDLSDVDYDMSLVHRVSPMHSPRRPMRSPGRHQLTFARRDAPVHFSNRDREEEERHQLERNYSDNLHNSRKQKYASDDMTERNRNSTHFGSLEGDSDLGTLDPRETRVTELRHTLEHQDHSQVYAQVVSDEDIRPRIQVANWRGVRGRPRVLQRGRLRAGYSGLAAIRKRNINAFPEGVAVRRTWKATDESSRNLIENVPYRQKAHIQDNDNSTREIQMGNQGRPLQVVRVFKRPAGEPPAMMINKRRKFMSLAKNPVPYIRNKYLKKPLKVSIVPSFRENYKLDRRPVIRHRVGNSGERIQHQEQATFNRRSPNQDFHSTSDLPRRFSPGPRHSNIHHFEVPSRSHPNVERRSADVEHRRYSPSPNRSANRFGNRRSGERLPHPVDRRESPAQGLSVSHAEFTDDLEPEKFSHQVDAVRIGRFNQTRGGRGRGFARGRSFRGHRGGGRPFRGRRGGHSFQGQVEQFDRESPSPPRMLPERSAPVHYTDESVTEMLAKDVLEDVLKNLQKLPRQNDKHGWKRLMLDLSREQELMVADLRKTTGVTDQYQLVMAITLVSMLKPFSVKELGSLKTTDRRGILGVLEHCEQMVHNREESKRGGDGRRRF